MAAPKKYFTVEERKAANRKGSRKWIAANREKIHAEQRKWRAANREKLQAAKRKYRAANREKIRAADRKYRAANPDKYREIYRKARIKFKARVAWIKVKTVHNQLKELS